MSMTEERLLSDFAQQPVSDEGPLPKFCIANHCTKRNKACAACAYTAMGSSWRRMFGD